MENTEFGQNIPEFENHKIVFIYILIHWCKIVKNVNGKKKEPREIKM